MRNEYPRPQFKRKSFINLNGNWFFDFDDGNIGHKEKWFNKKVLSKNINVPFCYESKNSGINIVEPHIHMWYVRELPKLNIKGNERTIIHFDGVDYYSEVFINGNKVGNHTGSSARFSIDISDYLDEDKNYLSVYCYDPLDEDILRGKQYWKKEPEAIWYNRTSGIYKSVWIEQVNECFLQNVFFTPDIYKGTLTCNYVLSKENQRIRTVIKNNNEIIFDEVSLMIKKEETRIYDIFKNEIIEGPSHNTNNLWSVDNPHLYSIEFYILDNDEVLDYVESYFAMRNVTKNNQKVYLNNRLLYQKLVLMQGYYRDGLLSASSVEDFKKDIKLAKALGFNGGRVHQKVEDDYFYYLCDKLGFLVWCESASAANYSKNVPHNMMMEWDEIIKQHYNFPSIIVWTPLNESWGINQIANSEEQRQFTLSMYHYVKGLDSTRFVISNDGWEQMTTDLLTVHNYAHGDNKDYRRHEWYRKSISSREEIINATPADRKILLVDNSKDEPIILSEYGGLAFVNNSSSGWGYTSVCNEEDYLNELRRIHKDINDSKALVGYCYTQLYDVEQEINGILTYDREPKVEIEKIKKINDSIKYVPCEEVKL